MNIALTPSSAAKPDRWTAIRLHAAKDRLHAAASRDEVFEAILEILSNFVGCEQAAIFLAANGQLSPEEPIIVGLSQADLKVHLFRDLLNDCIKFGDLTISRQPASEFSRTVPSACIPLRAAGTVTAVVCLFQLLPQRRFFTNEDREIFQLLSLVAGNGLARCSDQDRTGENNK